MQFSGRYSCQALVLLLLLLPFQLLAQQASGDSSISIPPKAYIQYMSGKIGLKLSQNSEVGALQVNTPSQKIVLQPNSLSATKLYVNYKFISFSVRYIPRFLKSNTDNLEKGKTSGSGFGMGFAFKHWLQSVSYSKTRGFFLENTRDFNPAWKPGDPYVQFPDLTYRTFEGATAYSFNSNYSLNAVISQTERQLKSAGSFIPGLLYRFYTIDDLSGNRPSQKTTNVELILGAGYYHTFVINKSIYLSTGITPAAGYVFTRLLTRFPGSYQVSHQTNPIFRLDGQLGLGYNGERFFGGIYSRLNSSAYNQQRTSAVNQEANLTFQLFFGIRIGAPKLLKEQVERVERLIPL